MSHILAWSSWCFDIHLYPRIFKSRSHLGITTTGSVATAGDTVIHLVEMIAGKIHRGYGRDDKLQTAFIQSECSCSIDQHRRNYAENNNNNEVINTYNNIIILRGKRNNNDMMMLSKQLLGSGVIRKATKRF